MRLNKFLLIGFVIPVTCTPVPPAGLQSNPDAHSAIKAVQAGVVASASMAGLIGASIGLTEYLANAYHRWAKNKMGRETKDSDNAFSREQKSTDTKFQNTGTDVVLSLVERYLEKQRKKKEEVMVDTELVEPEVEQARVADDGADDTEIDPSPPMPRLPGYPPLSEIDQRYDVKDSIKSSAEFVNTNVSKVEDTSSGVDKDDDSSCDTQGCDLHPICYNQEEPTK